MTSGGTFTYEVGPDELSFLEFDTGGDAITWSAYLFTRSPEFDRTVECPLLDGSSTERHRVTTRWLDYKVDGQAMVDRFTIQGRQQSGDLRRQLDTVDYEMARLD